MTQDKSYNTPIYYDQNGGLNFGNVVFSVDANGNLLITGVALTDPHVRHGVWSNNGVLTFSVGSSSSSYYNENYDREVVKEPVVKWEQTTNDDGTIKWEKRYE